MSPCYINSNIGINWWKKTSFNKAKTRKHLPYRLAFHFCTGDTAEKSVTPFESGDLVASEKFTSP